MASFLLLAVAAFPLLTVHGKAFGRRQGEHAVLQDHASRVDDSDADAKRYNVEMCHDSDQKLVVPPTASPT